MIRQGRVRGEGEIVPEGTKKGLSQLGFEG